MIAGLARSAAEVARALSVAMEARGGGGRFNESRHVMQFCHSRHIKKSLYAAVASFWCSHPMSGLGSRRLFNDFNGAVDIDKRELCEIRSDLHKFHDLFTVCTLFGLVCDAFANGTRILTGRQPPTRPVPRPNRYRGSPSAAARFDTVSTAGCALQSARVIVKQAP